jgi:hypothetical protein
MDVASDPLTAPITKCRESCHFNAAPVISCTKRSKSAMDVIDSRQCRQQPLFVDVAITFNGAVDCKALFPLIELDSFSIGI